MRLGLELILVGVMFYVLYWTVKAKNEFEAIEKEMDRDEENNT